LRSYSTGRPRMEIRPGRAGAAINPALKYWV